ncbi:MAG: hypothetical protein C5B54_02145 [Acidobacteria bacterium]|nr:MAG: hypothetical protein C5B54_02145 [Acidobacteriota bacterium]
MIFFITGVLIPIMLTHPRHRDENNTIKNFTGLKLDSCLPPVNRKKISICYNECYSDKRTKNKWQEPNSKNQIKFKNQMTEAGR